MIHISNLSICDPTTLPHMKAGEEWGVEVQYGFMVFNAYFIKKKPPSIWFPADCLIS